MGILKKLALKAAINNAENLLFYGAAVCEELTIENIKKNSTAQEVFTVERKTVFGKRNFVVYDKNHNEQYYLKTAGFTFGYPKVELYDKSNSKIGSVECTQKKMNEFLYSLCYKGQPKGSFSFKISLQLDIVSGLKNWHVEGNLLSPIIRALDTYNNLSVKITSLFLDNVTYVIEIANSTDVIEGLLLLMAIETARYGKHKK